MNDITLQEQDDWDGFCCCCCEGGAGCVDGCYDEEEEYPREG